MSTPIVVIVDDDPAVRSSLVSFLEAHGLSAAAYEGAEAVLAACSPDWQGCAVLDVKLKGMDGLALQAELRRRGVTLPVIFLTGYGDIPTTVRAMKAGACEFLTKPARGADLLPLIHAALAQDRQARTRGRGDLAQQERLGRLSQREWEVLQLVLAGHANKDIARQLRISHRTVEVHRSHILSKTGVGSMLELAHILSRGDPDEPAAAAAHPSP